MPSNLAGASNDQRRKFIFNFFLFTAELLHKEGIVKTIDCADFTFGNDAGEHTKVNLSSINYLNYIKIAREAPSVEASQIERADRGDPNAYYWFRYLSKSRTIYVKYNQVLNDTNDPFDSFIQRLNAFANETDFDRFVVDVRENGGGDNFLARRLAGMVSSSDRINRRGKLFLL